MDIATLEALGLTKDELADRIIDRAVTQLLQATAEDEDGYEYGVPSTFATKIDKVIREKIDAAVVKAGDEQIAPRITAIVNGAVLQKTNEWGERRGEPVTFTEYLVQRAEAYMTEPVSYDGTPKSASDSYSWRASGTRVVHMIDQHLRHHIEQAMKKALEQANSTIATGLNDAVKIAISNLQVTMKTDVKTK